MRWSAPLVAAIVTFGAVLLRQEGVPKPFTIWAEDGQIFANCAFRNPTQLTCLGEVYGGYFHAVPRLGAAFATLLPPAGLPIWLTLAAALVTAVCAALVARVVAELSGSRIAAALAGASLALTFQAGREVGGNLANLHWVLLVTAVVILVGQWVGRRPSGADLGLVAAAAFSSAFAPLVAFLAVPAAIGRWPASVRVLLVTALASVVQLGASLAHPRNEPVERGIDGASLLAFLAGDIVGRGAFGGRSMWLDGAVWIGLLVVAAALVRIASRPVEARAEARRCLVAVLALTGIGLAIVGASVVLNQFLGPRYAYVPATLAVIALLVGAAGVSRAAGSDPTLSSIARRLARDMAAAVSIGLVVGFGLSFRLQARASAGPDLVAAYREAREACEPGVGAIRLVTAPDPASGRWSVTIPCSRVP